ncbi:MAG: hypothetical protein K2N25_00585, partial [Muribaculaceae bacterium]|nr:hypothetical protein [Muribaculaceae bacterium]
FPYHGPPVITLFLVPMDGVSSATMNQLKDDFSTKFTEKQWEPYVVEILEHMDTPDSCYNDAKTRFRADKILRTLTKKYSEVARNRAKEKDSEHWAYHIVGVTNNDISTSVHGKSDYGILGLSFLGHKHGDASVVSTYRLKRQKDLWKLTAHEFCHGFYGCPHCKNDDPHCIMADAKGGNPHFEIKDSLYVDCANICLIGD